MGPSITNRVSTPFRAENSYTHRHMCEFTGLDFEMAIYEHYFEVCDILYDPLGHNQRLGRCY